MTLRTSKRINGFFSFCPEQRRDKARFARRGEAQWMLVRGESELRYLHLVTGIIFIA
jgi:hypothetical protein